MQTALVHSANVTPLPKPTSKWTPHPSDPIPWPQFAPDSTYHSTFPSPTPPAAAPQEKGTATSVNQATPPSSEGVVYRDAPASASNGGLGNGAQDPSSFIDPATVPIEITFEPRKKPSPSPLPR